MVCDKYILMFFVICGTWSLSNEFILFLVSYGSIIALTDELYIGDWIMSEINSRDETDELTSVKLAHRGESAESTGVWIGKRVLGRRGRTA